MPGLAHARILDGLSLFKKSEDGRKGAVISGQSRRGEMRGIENCLCRIKASNLKCSDTLLKSESVARRYDQMGDCFVIAL